ncbi:MAG: hypothetical protein E7473_12255 [Ruminococcaceae bacterium]|nr:hypothetical protein [Oscillospiraceae bacterium]
MAAQLTDDIDSDGQGTEGSNYNTGWHTNLIKINKYIDEYGKYSKFNLYNNSKFVQMFYSTLPLMSAYYTPQIGDTKACLGESFWTRSSAMLEGWTRLKDPVFAQMLYKLNNNSADDLKYDIYTKDPERLESEVENVIEQYGEYYRDSELMTNFGFAILRDGTEFNESVGATAVDNRRDVWMYFGTNAGHAHLDTLNIGMTAYGLNFLPELGYPETTGNQPNRLQWIDATLSHNTVMVDGKAQTENKNTTAEVRGKIKHFDDAGAVALMDVSAPYVYDSTDEYRRSVVMIRVDDEISYAVDFFRVLGGNEHLYSFHASSNEISETHGLDFTLVEDEDGNYISGSQLDENGNYKGTYAGRDVTYIKDTKTGAVRKNDGILKENEKVLELEFGDDPNSAANRTNRTLFPAGYTWLNNIDRDTEPENKVEIDFSIKDFNKAIKNSSGLHMRMTVHNATNVENGAKASVAIADGYPPRYVENKNIDKFKYVLVKNEGNALDTVFTTVLEPYRTARYLKDSNELSMSVYSGEEAEGDAARALKIEHENGRIDYVFYATNNQVTYEVADGDKKLYFRGFVGVYTLNKAGENIYTYVNDGDVIGSSTEKLEGASGRINVVVQSFTDVPAEKNEIVITPASPLSDEEIKNLAGKNIHIDNGALVRSGTFKIENAYPEGENVVLDVGRISPVRKYKDACAPESGYECMIKTGQSAYIPLSYSDDNAPEFEPVSDSITVSAGSSVSVTVHAESPLEGKSITYQAETLPRGASLNETTGVVTWKPYSSQIGENHVAITACDSDGRESTLHFVITVYGSTTGGIGNAGATTSTKPVTPEKPETPDIGDGADNDPVTEGTKTRFIDLSAHIWAKDAINSLANEGIVKGTSETTFSPANSITRADFALLMVRAFKLESENNENFSDVVESDYFAKELAIARNTGIVNGIGDNKYLPRNTITRQDMMVMVYRALQKLNVEFDIYNEPQYPDFDIVADYAKEAVFALTSAGIVNGKSNRIAPLEYTTRAEVAVLLKRVLDFIKQ